MVGAKMQRAHVVEEVVVRGSWNSHSNTPLTFFTIWNLHFPRKYPTDTLIEDRELLSLLYIGPQISISIFVVNGHGRHVIEAGCPCSMIMHGRVTPFPLLQSVALLGQLNATCRGRAFSTSPVQPRLPNTLSRLESIGVPRDGVDFPRLTQRLAEDSS